MEVIFQTEDGNSFTIEIGCSDKVKDVKEKIRSYTNIPPTHQILTFQGRVLEDRLNVQFYSVTPNSCIQIRIVSPFRNQGGPSTVSLLIKAPCSRTPFLQVVKLSDSVLQLKQKLHERLGIPPDILGVYLSRNHEMQDAKSLYDYGLNEGSVIYIYTKISSSSSSESEDSAGSIVYNADESET